LKLIRWARRRVGDVEAVPDPLCGDLAAITLVRLGLASMADATTAVVRSNFAAAFEEGVRLGAAAGAKAIESLYPSVADRADYVTSQIGAATLELAASVLAGLGQQPLTEGEMRHVHAHADPIHQITAHDLERAC
jgi:hypothetical protein